MDAKEVYKKESSSEEEEFDPEELESFWQRAILPNKQKAMAWKWEQEEALNA